MEGTMKERTAKNVHEAFVGEAKAYQRLLAYADKAEKEGLPQIAHLFRAIAASEGVHSRRHFRLLEVIKDTQTNMEYAFQQENAVNGNYYPKMIQEAEDDGEKAAALVFSQAKDVEGVHAKLYRKALEHLTEEEFVEYHVCSVCGFVSEGDVPDHCPVCNAPRDKFFKVE
jgi:rubrerythrin